jgi:hypothetical protein
MIRVFEKFTGHPAKYPDIATKNLVAGARFAYDEPEPTPRLDFPGPLVPRFRLLFGAAPGPRRAAFAIDPGREASGMRAPVMEDSCDRVACDDPPDGGREGRLAVVVASLGVGPTARSRGRI